jgi:CubicO group peptidase (beta-lactamase class C family)
MSAQNRREWLIASAMSATVCSLRFPCVAADAMPGGELHGVAARVLAAANAHGARMGAWGTSVGLSRGGVGVAVAAGYRDADRRRPVAPDALFRIASVTKPITAAIVRMLARAGRLSLEDRVFPLLGLKPDADRGDPRLNEIAIEHLLTHRGGWDRAASFDPMFHQEEIRRELDLPGPPGVQEIIRYMLRQPLQFAPGEKSAYSNFGYCLLGRVIEQATGTSYAEAVKTLIAGPLKVEADLLVGRHQERHPRETEYGGDQTSFDLDVMDAHGGLIATAAAICRFLEAYWITGEPRKQDDPPADWTSFGSLPGTSAMARQRPDGWNVAVLLNGRRDESYRADLDELRKVVDEAVG